MQSDEWLRFKGLVIWFLFGWLESELKGWTRNKHIYTSICHNLTQTLSQLNQYKLHCWLSNTLVYDLSHFLPDNSNLWPRCVFFKVFPLIYYLCYVIWIMHAFELRFELCNSAGSSLAQDRGRLESKIEALNSEVAILKKNLEVKLSRKITLSVLLLVCCCKVEYVWIPTDF